MMKLPLIALVLFSLSRHALAEDGSHASAPWSAVGKWDAVDPAWTDSLTIAPDGTFCRATGDAGRWTLSVDDHHVVLVLQWDHWQPTILTMFGPDDFHGERRGDESPGAITMRRAKTAPPAIETRTWRQGEPRVRLIRKEEGFCALSLVTGHFQGGGEVVRVYVDDDDYWYLDGKSGQEGVAAQCIIVRYPNR